MKDKIKKILNKKNKSKIVCLTAYSKNVAEEVDKFIRIYTIWMMNTYPIPLLKILVLVWKSDNSSNLCTLIASAIRKSIHLQKDGLRQRC